MQTKEITVTIIAKTEINYNAVGQWLTDMKVEYGNFHDQPDTTLLQRNQRAVWSKYNYPEQSPSGAALTELAGRRCYAAFVVGSQNNNLTQIRTDLGDYIDNILASGHGSVLEHANYTFAIEGLTRVATAELNRHRAGMAISEGSLRYIRPEEFSYWLPMSIRENDGDSTELKQAKEESRAVFVKAFEQMADNYDELERIWAVDTVKQFKEKKKLTSIFRRIIGMGVATGGVWTGNVRALRHIFEMRCSEAAEEEICYVASLMLEAMIASEPHLFGDFEKVNGYWQPKHRKV
jgi:thymidylate synthase (FAD)